MAIKCVDSVLSLGKEGGKIILKLEQWYAGLQSPSVLVFVEKN